MSESNIMFRRLRERLEGRRDLLIEAAAKSKDDTMRQHDQTIAEMLQILIDETDGLG